MFILTKYGIIDFNPLTHPILVSTSTRHAKSVADNELGLSSGMRVGLVAHFPDSSLVRTTLRSILLLGCA